MLPNRRIATLDANMVYIEKGVGLPIVFLHGNPTSSYLWRNVIPHVEPLGKCLAPDLIGMGGSDKLVGSEYRFFDHVRYLDSWFDAVVGESDAVTLVLHDWGSALGFYWAQRHPERIRAIVHMESITAPADSAGANEGARQFYAFMRSAEGERQILEENTFVESILGY